MKYEGELPRGSPRGQGRAMTTLTMRVVKGDFIVTGPDIAPMKFKSRPEARDWCRTHHPSSPITEIGPGGKRPPRKPPERLNRTNMRFIAARQVIGRVSPMLVPRGLMAGN